MGRIEDDIDISSWQQEVITKPEYTRTTTMEIFCKEELLR